eukprot:UN00592
MACESILILFIDLYNILCCPESYIFFQPSIIVQHESCYMILFSFLICNNTTKKGLKRSSSALDYTRLILPLTTINPYQFVLVMAVFIVVEISFPRNNNNKMFNNQHLSPDACYI